MRYYCKYVRFGVFYLNWHTACADVIVMTNHNQQKSATRGTKCEDSVALGTNELFPKDIYALSTDAFGFIFNMERRLNINDETDQFLRNVFKGFRDEVQDKMVECLRNYFEDYSGEGYQYLPLLGIEHIDMLMNKIVYKIEHGHR